MTRWHTGGERVDVLAFSPAGGLLASANFRATAVRLWHPDGTPAGRLAFGSTVWAVAFNLNGRELLVGGWRRPITAYSTADWAETGRVEYAFGCSGLAVAPDGSRLAAAVGASVAWWPWPGADAADPTPLGGWGRVGAGGVAFTPDGRRVLANGMHGVLDAGFGSARDVRHLPLPFTTFRGRVAVSPDGRQAVATRYSWDSVLWPLDGSARPMRLPGLRRDRSVRGLAFTADGASVLAAGTDGRMRRWDALTAGERPGWDLGCGGLRSLAVSPDGLLAAAGGRDGTITVWDL